MSRLGHANNRQLQIPITLIHEQESGISKVDTPALIDSGAEGEFIDQNYARNIGIKQTALEEPIEVFNVDGTRNKRGTINHYTETPLTIGNCTRTHRLYITGLGKQKILLGFSWLYEQNPDINWQTGDIKWRTEGDEEYVALPVNEPSKSDEKWVAPHVNEPFYQRTTIEEVEDDEEWKNSNYNESDKINNFNSLIIRYLRTDTTYMDDTLLEL